MALSVMGCHISTSQMATTPITAQQYPPQEAQQLPITAQATLAGQTFDLEVAQTPQQQQVGLMFRTHLAKDRGMLFPFDPPRPVSFWMKNTLIPLDLIYLRHGAIQTLYLNVSPCQTDPCLDYPSQDDIDQVIEIRGGRAQELGLKVGDRITVNRFNNR
jgi:uncharacterized membrane protein (UPF0127 family)